uniref:Dual specificity protein kinase TTK n=1 Tax=Oryzias sinensis TaxID=183150 RepID=A0A8C8DKI2_9TELE
MEEEEHTDRKQQLAMLFQKLNKIKKYLNEDDTDNINNVISSNSPESCLAYLMDLEKKGDPHLDHNHLTRLIHYYTKVFSNMPLGKHCQNESYARMLVRFAELKAIQDVNEAEANFNVARSHSPNFAFVHIAHARFEHSQGNTKRGIHMLQEAIKMGAKPKELLETALQNMQPGKPLSPSEDKENLPYHIVQDSGKNSTAFQKVGRISDGTGELQLSSIFSSGMEPLSGSSVEHLPGWRSGSHHKKASCLPGRVPVVPFSIQENEDSEGNVHDVHPKRGEMNIPTGLPRQTSGSNVSSVFGPSMKKTAEDGGQAGVRQPALSPEQSQWDDQAVAESTTTLLQRGVASETQRMEDVTSSFDQIVNSSSPESCWTYLKNLEGRGNPHTDVSLLNKLRNYYSTVFAKLPIRQYSKNSSYARILVRYAELKGIEDPDEAEDHFIVARSNCKGFAFVHIAHAQFEVSQGNMIKASSILHKALALNAQPSQLLNIAIRNLKAGEKRLLDPDEELLMETAQSASTSVEHQEVHLPARVPAPRSVDHAKPASKEWKLLPAVHRHVSPEEKRTTPPIPCQVESLMTPSLQRPSRLNPHSFCQTPCSNQNPNPNSFVTPVVKGGPEVWSSAVAAHRTRALQQSHTPLNPAASFQTPQASLSSLSNESITIKGKQFFVLKIIGRGGSSKVFQVLDHKKQLFAVKYVDLEEADAQTVESYKNEIEHLNHLQQYSDQIIKLYDYEITNSYIYMLMECGNLDLNTWLRNRKSVVNPLERKFYWKNMLEAVHTIHKHGIIHSDLKPANFVIVNASLKLIDFGIANRIQPDVTSIMKDSQVGTLNYMPPEAIKDTSSQSGKARSKISPKGDVWSLGCILYCMTYGKTPFQSITNQMAKLHAIIDPSHKIEFPDISEKDLLDVLKRCLVRNPRERISIVELLDHPYLQLKPQASPEPAEHPSNGDLQRILTDLAALQSPNSIIRAANVRSVWMERNLTDGPLEVLNFSSLSTRTWQKCAAVAGGWMLQNVQSHPLKNSGK